MPLAMRMPLGTRDCGQHEWRHWDDDIDVCSHCLAGERPRQPIDVPIDHELRMDLVRRAGEGDDLSARVLDRLHADDRELGRPRWRPPAT